jgi:RNA polymerase sigma factor (sigma-70 family)
MTPRLLQTVMRFAADGPDGPADAALLRRYAEHRDPAAFAELVRRHARLVWAVCRNLLPGEADAEDAFQAVWVTLVRRPAAVRDGRRLGPFLYGVAVRVCHKAKRTAARRRKHEQTAGERPGSSRLSSASPDWDDLLAVVHDEVARLPDHLRTPFVLCCLQGKGQTAAAAELGWKLGTLSGRLTRAKQAVLARLTARGVAPGVVPAAVLTGGGLAAAPARAVEAVVAAAAGTAAVSQSVLLLSAGVTDMTRTKLLAAGVLLAAATGLTGWSTGLVPTADAQPPSADAAPKMRTDNPPAQYRTRNDRGQADPAGDVARELPAGASYYRVPLPPGPQWEYKVMRLKAKTGDFPAAERELNALGADGWELATAAADGETLTFKRAKRPQAVPPVSAPPETTYTPPTRTETRPRTNQGDGLPQANAVPSAFPAAAAPAVTQMLTLDLGNVTEYAELIGKLVPGVTASGVTSSRTLVIRGPERLVKEAVELATAMAEREQRARDSRPRTK